VHPDLGKSKYHPKDDGNWLKHSFENGKVKPGWEDKPVTFVSIDDARAYCRFNKKRLPKPYEWQYFSQGGDETRLYPWGNVDDLSKTPILSQNFTNPGPEPVGKYPQGASPFGIQDLVRSVWQYTSVSRASILVLQEYLVLRYLHSATEMSTPFIF